MRLKPEIRKDEILAAAIQLTLRVGLNGLRRDAVAEEASVANGLVSRYFNTMTQLRHAVVRHAIHNEVLPIVAQALAAGDPEVRKASEDVKKKALATLIG
jgi:AcrR family transcriptional regulator